MTAKHTLQAIFFDFDGVIVDSNPTKTKAFLTLFSDYDKAIVAKIVAYHQQHGGISRVEKIQYAHTHLIKQPLTGEELARWAARYSELVVEEVINVDWIGGAKEFLDSNFSLDELITWAVASGGFACYYLGGTYFEKVPGEKLSKVESYRTEYRKQISNP